MSFPPDSVKRKRKTALTTVLIVVALVAISYITGENEKNAARLLQQLEVTVEQRHCVVASIEGRVVTTYRCDLPRNGEYVPAASLTGVAR